MTYMNVDIDDCVMIDADVVGPEHYIFVAHSELALQDKRYKSKVVEYREGIWQALADYEWESVAIVVSLKDPLRVEILGRDGQVGTVLRGSSTEAKIDPQRPVGPFRGLSLLNSQVFAYGMKREVFVRKKDGAWIRNNEGMETALLAKKLSVAQQIKLRTRDIGGINAITIDDIGQIVAVGMRGEIWLWQKTTWVKIDSPTNLMLKDATYCMDGHVYVCGQVGTLLKGSGTRWEPVSYDGPQGLDLTSICCFRGLIYVADGHSLRVLNHGELRVVDFGVEDIVPCASVVANSQRIISVAGQEVWHSSDGSRWDRLLG